jgi:adenylate cyclase
MLVLFVCLSIPILIFILVYNYQRNAAAMVSTLDEAVASTSQVSIESAENFIHPVGETLRLLAGFAGADPNYFRTEASAELLYRALTSAKQIDAAYVSFEDGYHRVVTRMDEDRRRSDPKIPSTANWHSSYIDDFSAGPNRARHRTFFDTWGHVVGGYSVPSTLDIRVLEGYAETKASRDLAVTEPSINPDTGYPILSIRYPILRNDEFIGAASVNITMDVLSRFLANHRASAHSTSLIADQSNGRIIASAVREQSVRPIDGKLTIATLDNVGDPNVRAAARIRREIGRGHFLFNSPMNGDEVSASFVKFPDSFGKPWQTIILTPTNDFIGDLKIANRKSVFVIIGLTAVELLLIYALSRRLSRPIEDISHELESVEALAFEASPIRASNIKEIAHLQSAAALLRNSLRSFSSFVPLDIVRELIKSRTPLTLGVEQRYLTVFFSDLENFSSHAEQLAPNDLLSQLSVYFEQVSGAISQEHGTVDKFIGDGVMAFWGAPVPRADHVLRGCTGALRAARRMEHVNRRWEAEGRPKFRIRIGLHCANVLVGNVGSSERLNYTVMGDGVNVAARLEAANKTFGTTICVSDSVVEAAGPDLVVRPLRKTRVKGREHEFMIYELLGLNGSNDPEIAVRGEDSKLSVMTRSASDSFERGDFTEASHLYRIILQDFPHDPVARSMLIACSSSGTLKTTTAAVISTGS